MAIQPILVTSTWIRGETDVLAYFSREVIFLSFVQGGHIRSTNYIVLLPQT